jgi:amino acid adenylation domain-containing protein
MLVHDRFEETAQRLPDKTALVCAGRRLTYGELRQRVHALASALRSDGVQPGDRVVLLLESDIEYAIAVHAAWLAGAVIVPLMPSTKAEKLAFVIADTGATALLTHRVLAAVWTGIAARCPTLRRVRSAEEFDAPSLQAAPHHRAIDQDLAALIYTSGSTGRPKGVMLTHLNMVSAWNSVQHYLRLREDDVIGLALPPMFSYGLYNLVMGLGLGATVVLERQAAFPVKLLQCLALERVTVFPGVPTLLAALLDQPQLRSFDLGAIRLITNAAAALPVPHVQAVRATWPLAELFLMYGMTECMRISYLEPRELDRRPGSVGLGMPNQEHWLVDETGLRLPPGAVGELVVRGSHVMRGYWSRPQETAERLHRLPGTGESVLRTGDIFRSDADGYLHFLARTDDIIKTRGEKIAPREVEEIIHQIADVKACAVVGVPDVALGEAVKAYVTLCEGSALLPRDIVRHCLAHLENHMAPKFVEIVDELPTTESGKIRHAELRSRSGAPT